MEKGKVKPLPVPTPPVNPNTILVKVSYSFISTGTEGATVCESKKSLLKKCLSNTNEKITKVMGAVRDNGIMGTMALVKGSLNKVIDLGYSCSGQVVAIGKNISTFQVGDFVACAGAGVANHAEYVAVPQHLAIKLTSNKSLKQASLTTIGAIALQGVRRANLALGERVCVIGLGLIGQLTVQLAKLSGCTVYGVDIDDSKLFLAQKFGCDHLYNSLSTNLAKEIPFHTEHRGVDATIITAASQSGEIIQQAMEVTRRKGKVVLVGDVKLDFKRSPFYEKEIDFLISCSYGPGRYDTRYEQDGTDYPYDYVRWTENRNMKLFADLVQAKKIQVDPLISQEFLFNNASEAYSKLIEKKSLGLVLAYEEKIFDPEPPKTDIVLDPGDQPIAYAVPDKITIGFVGVGGFAKVKLLPIVSKIKGASINAIIDTNPSNAINIAKQYNAAIYHNNYQEILQDDKINTVVIATPHALHAQQAIACLRAGKAVFVEKPAAVNDEQYKQLETFLNTNKNGLYCVDFNRSFAPFILKIKKTIKNRTTPLIIHYRVNAGFIPKDHWIQSEKHGGRIVGEACHIFELFGFLTGAKATNVSVQSINTTREDLCQSDNFSAQISFDDGSVCTLLYTAMGNEKLEKERMELFFDGKSIVLDDYKKLTGYGLPRTFNETTNYPDKGHKELLERFVRAAQTGSATPLSHERILQATRLSLRVRELAL